MKILIAVLALSVVLVNAQRQQQQQYWRRRPVEILLQTQAINPSGYYRYSYDTENGISASESSVYRKANNPEGFVMGARGQFQYTAPDGTPIKLTYVADENGFYPQGAHLPPAIVRALEHIRLRQLQAPK